MSLGPTYSLAVDLADMFGGDPANVVVEVTMVEERLIYPLGSPTETLFPAAQHKNTDADGRCSFNLLPSSQAGNYQVTIGGFSRVITMPAEDSRLSELGDAVGAGELGDTALTQALGDLRYWIAVENDGTELTAALKRLNFSTNLTATVDSATGEVTITGQAGGGTNSPTDLGHSRTATQVTITSSTGADTVLLAATTTQAGVMSANDRSLLNASISQAGADARYLQLSGGTLSGHVTLSGAPTANLHASTKQYVDTQISGLTLGDENVQANWVETDSSVDSFIRNKPTIPTLPADAEIGDKAFSNPPSDLSDAEKAAARSAIGAGTGDGTGTATPLSDDTPQQPDDSTGAAGTGTAASRADHKHPLPAEATTSAAGLMPSTAVSKLAGIESGATGDQTATDILTLLSLTAQNLNDMVVNAALSGTTLTFTQKDGTTIPISLNVKGDKGDRGPAGTAGEVLTWGHQGSVSEGDYLSIANGESNARMGQPVREGSITQVVVNLARDSGSLTPSNASSQAVVRFWRDDGAVSANYLGDATIELPDAAFGTWTAEAQLHDADGNAVDMLSVPLGSLIAEWETRGTTSDPTFVGCAAYFAVGSSDASDDGVLSTLALGSNGVLTATLSTGGTVTADLSPLLNGVLALTGGTMTGALTLSGAPTADLHAATKKYVDDNGGGELTRIGYAASDTNLANARSGTSPFNIVQITTGFTLNTATVADTEGNGLTALVAGDLVVWDEVDSKWERIYTRPTIAAQNSGTALGTINGINFASNLTATYDGATGIVTVNGQAGGTASITNLGHSRTATAVTITSSDGTDTTLLAATTTEAGVMTANDRSLLEASISEAGADARYLRLSGGTLTGHVTLSADPTANLHAATKQYVDSNAGDTNPSDAQIGDKAFSNPPSDLSDTEKTAVRTAIGATDSAASGSNVPDKPSTPASTTSYTLQITDAGAATWEEFTGGTGTTNLGASYGATSVTITSSSGTDVAVSAASDSQAGVMSAADKGKLDSLGNSTIYSVPGAQQEYSTTTIDSRTVRLLKLTIPGITDLSEADAVITQWRENRPTSQADIPVYIQINDGVQYRLRQRLQDTGADTPWGDMVPWGFFMFVRPGGTNYIRIAGEAQVDLDIDQNYIYGMVKEILQAGDNITLTEDDTDNELTITGQAGSATATNLTATYETTTVTVQSSTGADVALAGATGSVAGIMTAADKTALDAALPKSGGTLTGALTLSGAPTADLHAASKKYVDDNASSGSGIVDARGETLAAPVPADDTKIALTNQGIDIVVREIDHGTSPDVDSWGQFTHGKYLGVFAFDPSGYSAGEFYYNSTTYRFRIGVTRTVGGSTIVDYRDMVTGDTGFPSLYIGHYNNRTQALDHAADEGITSGQTFVAFTGSLVETGVNFQPGSSPATNRRRVLVPTVENIPYHYCEFWGSGQSERWPTNRVDRSNVVPRTSDGIALSDGTGGYGRTANRFVFESALPDYIIGGDVGIRALLGTQVTNADLLEATLANGTTVTESIRDYAVVSFPPGCYKIGFRAGFGGTVSQPRLISAVMVRPGVDDREIDSALTPTNSITPAIGRGNTSALSQHTAISGLVINSMEEIQLTFVLTNSVTLSGAYFLQIETKRQY